MQNARRTIDDANSKHYWDLKIDVQNVPCQEYDIIDSNYNTIDVDRPQYAWKENMLVLDLMEI